MLFTGLARIDLAEATAIMNIHPVLITLGAALFLGERLGPRRLLARLRCWPPLHIAYIGLIFATFWGISIFAEYPDLWTVIGALVIAVSGIYVWHRETRA